MSQPIIGIIGMGSMGAMYAKRLSDGGWNHIHVCDRPEKYEAIKAGFAHVQGVTVLPDGHAVSRSSDFIMYCVEAEFIDKVVSLYGPSTKLGATVGGQTSVKAPEIAAFERHLPTDVQIVTLHSLHGPTISPVGQPLVIIQHRASNEALHMVERIFSCFQSRYVHLSAAEHDLVTANTQAVTHAAFLSMGTAWCASRAYPWEDGLYVGGIETVKVNIMLRIYNNQWHVYAGLAILNPSARVQIDQYATSVTDMFKLMLAGDEVALRKRVYQARKKVFSTQAKRRPILLSESLLDRFSLGKPSMDHAAAVNSHLSLLAMVDCWAQLDINPFDHLALAATPIFRIFLGVAEALFVEPESDLDDTSSPCALCQGQPGSRLDTAIHAACHDTTHRSDDLEFTIAARGWSQCISFQSFSSYQRRFQETRGFFQSRFDEAVSVGTQMLQAVMEEGH